MKNKVVIKDEFGDRWFITKKGLVWPTDWKKQCYLITEQVHKKQVKEKLYGKGK